MVGHLGVNFCIQAFDEPKTHKNGLKQRFRTIFSPLKPLRLLVDQMEQPRPRQDYKEPESVISGMFVSRIAPRVFLTPPSAHTTFWLQQSTNRIL